MSYLGGRETFGYAKTMGRFDPPGGIGRPRDASRPSAANFGRNEGADWRPFLEVDRRRGQADRAPPERSSGTLPLVRHLVGDMPELTEGAEVLLGDIQLTAGPDRATCSPVASARSS